MAARHPRAAPASPFHLTSRRRTPDAEAPTAIAARTGDLDRPHVARRHPYRGALLFAALMAGLTVLVWGASTDVLRAASDALHWLGTHDTSRGRALATVLCAAAGTLALIGTWARETAERRPVRLAGGRARMAVDEVAAALRDAILDDTGLVDAEVRVRNLHVRGLWVAVRADIQPQARIDDTIDGVDAAVREVVQQHLGARLAARPAVDVRYQELDLRLGRGT